MKMKFLIMTFAFFMIGLTSACNTIEGAGEDIEAGGEKIQDATD